MSPDEEFVRARHPQADLVEVNNPAPGQSKWCVHYHPDLDSKIMGQGDTPEQAWANAREKCAGDAFIN
jgi:hypothetical protein